MSVRPTQEAIEARASAVRSFIYGQWGYAGDERVRPALEALDALKAEAGRVRELEDAIEMDAADRAYAAGMGASEWEAFVSPRLHAALAVSPERTSGPPLCPSDPDPVDTSKWQTVRSRRMPRGPEGDTT